jgi:hypothetical protein
MRKLRVVFVVAALAVAGACSDDNPSASDRACDARDEMSEQWDAVRSAVSSGDFDEARASATELRTAASEFRTAVGVIPTDVRDEVQPYVESLQVAVDGLDEVTTIADFQDQLQTVGAEFDALFDQVRVRLRCN